MFHCEECGMELMYPGLCSACQKIADQKAAEEKRGSHPSHADASPPEKE